MYEGLGGSDEGKTCSGDRAYAGSPLVHVGKSENIRGTPHPGVPPR